MAHPETFNSMIDVAYVFTFIVTMLFAALGYLMFGNGVSSEITRDLAKTPGYPVALNKLAVWMVAVSGRSVFQGGGCRRRVCGQGARIFCSVH